LDGKQATIADGDLTIAKTSGLQTALDGKQATIADGDLTIAKTSGLQTALDGKQATIADGDLTIAKTSGLQTALDSKEDTITGATDIVCNNISVGGLIDNTSNVMYYYNNTQTLTGTTAEANLTITGSSNSNLITKDTDSRFQVETTGRYRITAVLNIYNNSYTDRATFRGRLQGTFTSLFFETGFSYCYVRLNSYGRANHLTISSVLDLTALEYFYLQITCDKTTATGQSSNMSGFSVLGGSNICIEYLGS
jgi:hypothetical protein